MFWRYGTIFGLSFGSDRRAPRAQPFVGQIREGKAVFGKNTRARQARERAFRLHLRGRPWGAAREHPEVRPGAPEAGSPSGPALPRLPGARLLRARRRHPPLGEEGVGA